MKKNRILPVVAGLGLVAAAAPINTSLAITSEDWRYDSEKLFGTSMVDIANTNISGLFNENGVANKGMRRMCFLSYDEEVASQAQVEGDLIHYDQSPKWLKYQYCFDNQPSPHEPVLVVSVFNNAILSENNPGIVYYVIKAIDYETDGEYNLWGKIDFHRCAYNPDTEPKLSDACFLLGYPDKPYFTHLDGSLSETYVSWADSWRDTLVKRLPGLESRVEAWDGDELEKDALLDELKTFEGIAADATDADELQKQAQTLLKSLEEKIVIITPPKQPEPENPTPTEPVDPNPVVPDPDNPNPVDPTPDNPTPDNPTPEQPKPDLPKPGEDKEQDTNNPKPGHNSGSSRPTGSGGVTNSEVTTGSSNDKPVLGLGANQDSSVALGVNTATKVTNNTKKSVQMSSKEQIAYNDADKDNADVEETKADSSEIADNSDVLDDDLTKDNIVVPDLHESNEGQSWWIWLIGAGLLIIGAAIWWCQRAFRKDSRR